MKKFWISLGAITCSLVLVGCSQNIARLSVASTGNLPITNAQKGEYVTGGDCLFYVLWIPFGNAQNRVSGSVAKALEKATRKGEPDEALYNVDISEAHYGLGKFLGLNCIKAKGQGIEVKH